MNLAQQEIAQFYKLWYNMLWGINEKHNIIPYFEKPVYGIRLAVDIEEFIEIRNAMWDNPHWIDEFLADHDNDEFTEQERGIIAFWRKHFIKGEFLVMKHLAKYSVLMTFGSEPTLLYGVCGITNSLKDALPCPTPFPVSLVLLPFGDKIIYDSLASPFNIMFGPSMCASAKEWYNEAEEKYGIIEMLNGEEPTPRPPGERPKKRTAKAKAVSAETTTVPKGVNVPKAMATRYNEIAEIITKFCDEKLDAEYKDISLRALAKLCRKRPSPLESGRARTWAAGIVYSIGANNFIFDKSQPINMTATEIAGWFGLSKSTVGSKATEVSNILDLSRMDTEFTLKRIVAKNPAIWFLKVNGFLVDIRTMPHEVQEQAYEQGFIPYIPADEDTKG